MSGGSYLYAFRALRETADDMARSHPDKPHVQEFVLRMYEIAEGMRRIEYADSGDYSWDAVLASFLDRVTNGCHRCGARGTRCPNQDLVRLKCETFWAYTATQPGSADGPETP